MSSINFLQKFVLNENCIPDLEQIYHHVYFRDLEETIITGNEQVARFMGFTSSKDIKQKKYDEIIPDPNDLKVILDNDVVIIKEQRTKIFEEPYNIDENSGHFISIKSPLYNDNNLIGICGISLTLQNLAFSDISNVLTTVGNHLEEDLLQDSNNISNVLDTVKSTSKLIQLDWDTVFKLKLDELDKLLTKRSYSLLTSWGSISLSKREIQTLVELIKGCHAGQIASSLKLKQVTIESYIANIKDKLGVSSKSELINFIISNNLLKQIFL